MISPLEVPPRTDSGGFSPLSLVVCTLTIYLMNKSKWFVVYLYKRESSCQKGMAGSNPRPMRQASHVLDFKVSRLGHRLLLRCTESSSMEYTVLGNEHVSNRNARRPREHPCPASPRLRHLLEFVISTCRLVYRLKRSFIESPVDKKKGVVR